MNDSNDPKSDDGASTAALTKLRKSLIPDNALIAVFTTTSGPSLETVIGTVLVGSHLGGDQRVLWFEVEGQMFPTGES